MKWREELQALFDLEVAKDRFSVPSVYAATFDRISLDIESAGQYIEIRRILGDRVAKHVLQGILRATFLIELVKKPKIESTKFEVRWAERLGSDDPRYATYVECLEIFEKVIADLRQKITDPFNCELLRRFNEENIIPYEIPLDYRERTINGRMHVAINIGWFFDDLAMKVELISKMPTQAKMEA